MKKVIVTGATGMIGINLIQKLLSENIEVLAIIRENSKRKEKLPDNSNLKIIECDLENINNLDVKDIDKGYDCFYHLAWSATGIDERNDIYSQVKNIKYTLDAVNLAKKLNCKKFIGAGSQAEYGRNDYKIGSETIERPENAYGMAKLCAGQTSRLLANEMGIEHIWTRIFSLYGPYESEDTMIITSIRNMINGLSPEYTWGEQDWDYLYIEDAINALYLLGKEGKNNKIYCIGSGKTKKIKEYIEIIKNELNPLIELKLGVLPYRDKQVMHLCADISEIIQDTGFCPKVEFNEGIKRTINWYKREHNL